MAEGRIDTWPPKDGLVLPRSPPAPPKHKGLNGLLGSRQAAPSVNPPRSPPARIRRKQPAGQPPRKVVPGEKRWKVLNQNLSLVAQRAGASGLTLWQGEDLWLEQKLLLGEDGLGFQKPPRGTQSPFHHISCLLGKLVGFFQLDRLLGSRQNCVVHTAFEGLGILGADPRSAACQGLGVEHRFTLSKPQFPHLYCKLGDLTRGPGSPPTSSNAPT